MTLREHHAIYVRKTKDKYPLTFFWWDSARRRLELSKEEMWTYTRKIRKAKLLDVYRLKCKEVWVEPFSAQWFHALYKVQKRTMDRVIQYTIDHPELYRYIKESTGERLNRKRKELWHTLKFN